MLMRITTKNAIIPFLGGGVDYASLSNVIGDACIPFILKEGTDWRTPKGFQPMPTVERILDIIPNLDDYYAVVFDPDVCPEATFSDTMTNLVYVLRKDCVPYVQEN